MYRFFTDTKLILGGAVELDDEELHHLKKVLRVRPREKIEIVNGQGALGTAIFDESITLLSLIEDSKPLKSSALIQAIPEKSHLEFILEKGTEIGITEFHLFPAERSKLKELSSSYLTRLKKITISALKQSKRLFLPTLEIHSKFPNLTLKLYLADPKGSPFTPSPESAGFIVGPESGFTKEEIHLFQSKYGATPIALSKNILRAETAALVSSFLLSS